MDARETRCRSLLFACELKWEALGAYPMSPDVRGGLGCRRGGQFPSVNPRGLGVPELFSTLSKGFDKPILLDKGFFDADKVGCLLLGCRLEEVFGRCYSEIERDNVITDLSRHLIDHAVY